MNIFKRLYYRLIGREYVHVVFDLSNGNAYEYKINAVNRYPTTISFGRLHNGKYQSKTLSGNWSIQHIDEFEFVIKRGYKMSNINKLVRSYLE